MILCGHRGDVTFREYRRRSFAAFTSLLALLAVGAAQAGPFGSGITGAVKGAIIGDLIGGDKGAAAGAVVGGIVGAQSGASRDEQYLAAKQAEADARLDQWESEQRQRELKALEEEERAEQIDARAAADDQALLEDTQRALIRLGYDAGIVGMRGPELTTAIVRYQESRGMLPTGALSKDLLEHLLEESPDE